MLPGVKFIECSHELVIPLPSEALTNFDGVADLIKHVEYKRLVLDLFLQNFGRKSIVPLRRVVGDILKAPQAEEFGVEADVSHSCHELLYTRHLGSVPVRMEVRLIMQLRITELLLLNLGHNWSFRSHLVKLLEHLVADLSLFLIERLDGVFDLLH